MEKLILNKEESYFSKNNAIHTATEINQQPEVWRKVVKQCIENKGKLSSFMKDVLSIEHLNIIFTGAGSSAFVGEVMEYVLAEECKLKSRTYHTTDIISSPDATLVDEPTLLISYARSGESPESVAAVRFASKVIKNLYNLIIVCDGNSSLAKLGNELENTLVVALPQEACDQGFAMTSSVSSMALTTWLLFHYQELERYGEYVLKLADEVEGKINDFATLAETFANQPYRRLVWLGTGALQGLARESAIKSMELSDGYVHASYDGATAFRHGPKTVINDETVTVHYVTNKTYAKQYDIDLNNELNAEKNKNQTITVAEEGIKSEIGGSNFYVEYPTKSFMPENTQIDAYIYGLLFAQLLSMFKSLKLGYTTDNPCPKGDVNRVVKGIVIYELE